MSKKYEQMIEQILKTENAKSISMRLPVILMRFSGKIMKPIETQVLLCLLSLKNREVNYSLVSECLNIDRRTAKKTIQNLSNKQFIKLNESKQVEINLEKILGAIEESIKKCN